MIDIGIQCTYCQKTFEMPRWVIIEMYNKIMDYTPIPKEEIELFKFLAEDIEVLFDVGARTDTDYLQIKPSLKAHLFEPNPEFNSILESKGVKVNKYGLSDKSGEFHYDPAFQSFRDNKPEYPVLPVKTIDWYCKENGIEKIDFLKTDTEGWDLKVILGAYNLWPQIKYIQYEHWNDQEMYDKVLSSYFVCEYIGYRNVLCMNKDLLSPERIQEVIKFIRANKMAELQ